jgi:hypothetical protein
MTLRLLTLMMLAAVAAAGCGGNRFERPGYAFGCPTGMEKKISDKEGLIEAKVEGAGNVGDVRVVDMRCTERGNLLRIDVDLNNASKNVRRIAYRFRWLDKEGMRAWDDEAWKPVLIYGKTLHTVSALSPSQDAADFRLVLMSQDPQ